MADLGTWAMRSVITLAAPVALAAVAAGVIASVSRCGRSSRARRSSRSRAAIDPRQGIKRLFGTTALFETGKATAKTAVVGMAAFFAIWPRLTELAALTGMPPGAMLTTLASMVARIALYVVRRLRR